MWQDGPTPPEEHQPPRRGDSGGVMIRCAECDGTGEVPGQREWDTGYYEMVRCPECKGKGYVEDCPEWDD